MDVMIQSVTSTIRVADSQALLSPEVLQRIVAAVKEQLEQEKVQQAERESDTTINRGASHVR